MRKDDASWWLLIVRGNKQKAHLLLTWHRRLCDVFMLRWTSQVVCRSRTRTARERPIAGILLEQQPARRLQGRPPMPTGWSTSLSLQVGSCSSSQRSATPWCWWCCCGVEVARRSELSCSLGLWPSPTLVWCSPPSGWRLIKKYMAGCSGSSLASYSTSVNGWRRIVPYGLWLLFPLIGIYVLLNISFN